MDGSERHNTYPTQAMLMFGITDKKWLIQHMTNKNDIQKSLQMHKIHFEFRSWGNGALINLGGL